MQILKLRTLHGHLDDALFKCPLFLDDGVQLRILFATDFLLAYWALQIVEDDTGSIPLFLHLGLDAIQMHDVTAVKLYRRLLTDARAEADWAKLFVVAMRPLVFGHLFDALRLETR